MEPKTPDRASWVVKAGICDMMAAMVFRLQAVRRRNKGEQAGRLVEDDPQLCAAKQNSSPKGYDAGPKADVFPSKGMSSADDAMDEETRASSE